MTEGAGKSLPKFIRFDNGKVSAWHDVAYGSMAPYASLGRMFSHAIETWPHDAYTLLVELTWRTGEARSAKKRCGWMIGRFVNWASSADPNYVFISAAHFRQLMEMTDENAPEIGNPHAKIGI